MSIASVVNIDQLFWGIHTHRQHSDFTKLLVTRVLILVERLLRSHCPSVRLSVCPSARP